MVFLRKYAGSSQKVAGIPFIVNGGSDFVNPPTVVSGDVMVSKDEGSWTNIENTGVAGGGATFSAIVNIVGTQVYLALTPTLLTCKRLVIRFIDQTGPKQWQDQEIIVETHGNASAQYIFDFDSGQASDWSTQEKNEIRSILGVAGTKATPGGGGSLQLMNKRIFLANLRALGILTPADVDKWLSAITG